jgi:hypothetical protein
MVYSTIPKKNNSKNGVLKIQINVWNYNTFTNLLQTLNLVKITGVVGAIYQEDIEKKGHLLKKGVPRKDPQGKSQVSVVVIKHTCVLKALTITLIGHVSFFIQLFLKLLLLALVILKLYTFLFFYM